MQSSVHSLQHIDDIPDGGVNIIDYFTQCWGCGLIRYNTQECTFGYWHSHFGHRDTFIDNLPPSDYIAWSSWS